MDYLNRDNSTYISTITVDIQVKHRISKKGRKKDAILFAERICIH